VKKVARAYSAAEIRKLIVASPEHERLLWHFFIGTGAREKEVATACWRDIDFGRQTFKVHLCVLRQPTSLSCAADGVPDDHGSSFSIDHQRSPVSNSEACRGSAAQRDDRSRRSY
jgi:hypothetical protein